MLRWSFEAIELCYCKSTIFNPQFRPVWVLYSILGVMTSLLIAQKIVAAALWTSSLHVLLCATLRQKQSSKLLSKPD